jgi:hypothetical protein
MCPTRRGNETSQTIEVGRKRFRCSIAKQEPSTFAGSGEVKRILLTLPTILAVIWAVLWLALHITSGLIHILNRPGRDLSCHALVPRASGNA